MDDRGALALVLAILERGGTCIPAAARSTVLPWLPGPLPVALSRHALDHTVKTQDYAVCEKSDGERAVLLIAPSLDGAVLVNRALKVRRAAGPYAALAPRGVSLLDGELLPPDASRPIATAVYLIFDVLAWDSVPVGAMPFSVRMGFINKARAAFKEAPAAAAFEVHLLSKLFVPARHVDRVLACITTRPDGAHVYANGIRVNATDGLVFTPLAATYAQLMRRSATLFKWKFACSHTVDFALMPRTLDAAPDSTLALCATVPGGSTFPLAPLYDLPREVADAATHASDNKTPAPIVECTYDCAAGEWRYVRIRPDKVEPNFITTAWHTLERVAEQLDAAALVAALVAPAPVSVPATTPSNIDADATATATSTAIKTITTTLHPASFDTAPAASGGGGGGISGVKRART